MAKGINSEIDKLLFKGKWRSYQQRVLDELNIHLSDKKLNIIAAPGAGKTTLGIEVLLRLGQPALILAPTITIKNQWKERIVDNFLPKDDPTDWISTDIKKVSTITISTYQGLHSIYKNEEDRKNFIKELKRLQIKTFVFDEAHHLRTEWYVTLQKLCDEISDKDLKIVSLTGTPPYDVSPAEWENYKSLCGPIDAEISIPELVKAGDLCPHQDLVYFSDLTDEEKNIVFDFKAKRDEFFNYIKTTPDVLYAIETSPFVSDLDNNIDLIYKDTNFTLAIISFLLNEDSMNLNARTLMAFLDLTSEQMPKFTYETAEILFDGMLGDFQKHFKNIPIIKGKLKEVGLIDGKKVDFTGKLNLKKLFARSNNKLSAIYDITKLEMNILGKRLREVILLDYIGKGDSEGLNIISTFDKLEELNTLVGILTGTVIIIPATAKEELYKILSERKISSQNVITAEYKKDYLRVETIGNVDIVSVITELFEKGFINVLIGTAALLGEGWDSPSINTLIIASVVGSFMLSNQMRGRALRINKNDKNKTSNIWHLVSLDRNLEENQDYRTVTRRFETFEGISYTEDKIQNGIDRLAISTKDLEGLNCSELNTKMFSYAKDRELLPEKWEQVFNKSSKDTVSKVYSIAEISNILPEAPETNNWFEKMTADLYKRHRLNFSKQEQLKLANCILDTLCYNFKITTPRRFINIKSYENSDGRFGITVMGCTENERNIFIKSFSEIFIFNENIRYILRYNTKKGTRYLPVPELIGLKQEYVKDFVRNIKEIIETKINKTKKIAAISNVFFIGLFLSSVLLSNIIGLNILYLIFFGIIFCGIYTYTKVRVNILQEGKNIDIIYTKSFKNRQELLKAKYNTYLLADIKQNRVWV